MMWHAFWPILFWISLFLGNNPLAQDGKELDISNMGLSEFQQTLTNKVDINYQSVIRTGNSPIRLLSELESEHELRLSPAFFHAIALNTPVNYLEMLRGNDCDLYSLLEAGLLRDHNGPVKIVNLLFMNKEGIEQSASLGIHDYLSLIYKKKCFQVKDNAQLVDFKNISLTMKNLKMTPAKDLTQCLEQHNHLKRNPITPHLCSVHEKIKWSKVQIKARDKLLKTTQPIPRSMLNDISNGKKYETLLDSFEKNYLISFCENIHAPDQFCQIILKADTWKKSIKGQIPLFAVKERCELLLKKEKLNDQDLEQCAMKLRKNDQLCTTLGALSHPSLFPKKSCTETANALGYSRLMTKYYDCPGFIDNEGLTNIFRIMAHYFPDKFIKEHTTQCDSNTLYTYNKMLLESDLENHIETQACFVDKVLNKENCYPFVPGHHEDIPISESLVIQQIVSKILGGVIDRPCQIVSGETFSPELLKYRQGCFIVIKRNTCTTLSCDKKIFFDAKEIKGISFKGHPNNSYFPISFTQNKASLTKILDYKYKIREKILRNYNDIQFFLDLDKMNLIHGVGCLEDIYPQIRARYVINQCSPIPFIIDGIHNINNSLELSFRASIDDVHGPRLIKWNNVFNAVSNYSKLHPLGTWTLYGLRKN